MLVHERPIKFFLDKLRKGSYFCLPGYSDAEFYSMMAIRLGKTTGLGQVLDKRHGDLLTGVMQRRQSNKQWLFAVPKCLDELPEFQKYPINKFLKDNRITIEGYERDTLLDDAARDAKLFPLIYQLQQMDTVVIGPKELSNGGLSFLDYKYHIPIASPNLHMEKNGIENVVEVVRNKGRKPAMVYLISAGVSAPVIIDKLYEFDPYNFYLDVGSIWDAFVGIGGQRQWRADLYANPEALETWKRKNVYGS